MTSRHGRLKTGLLLALFVLPASAQVTSVLWGVDGEAWDPTVQPWVHDVEDYFFAFHNAAHSRTPFAVRFPGEREIGQLGGNGMRAGEFCDVEVGQQNGRSWLKMNDILLLEATHAQPFPAGMLHSSCADSVRSLRSV